MNRRATLALAALAAMSVGVALPVSEATAQSKAQAYYITDIAPADPEGCARERRPRSRATRPVALSSLLSIAWRKPKLGSIQRHIRQSYQPALSFSATENIAHTSLRAFQTKRLRTS